MPDEKQYTLEEFLQELRTHQSKVPGANNPPLADDYAALVSTVEDCAANLKKNGFAAILFINPTAFQAPLGLLKTYIPYKITLDTQAEFQGQALTRAIFGEEITARQFKKAKPNDELLDAIKEIASETLTGKAAIKWLQKSDTKVVFIVVPDDVHMATKAQFDEHENRIYIIRHKNDTAKDLADTFIHECRHIMQHAKFPELYDLIQNIIDQYVATKLKEYDAWTTQQAHIDAVNTPNINMLEHIFGKSQSTLENLSPSVKVYWHHYELHFGSRLISALKAGGFKERVAASPYLQPAFLKRFAIAPNGNRYTLKDPEKFRKHLIETISTLHNPALIWAASIGDETMRRSAGQTPQRSADKKARRTTQSKPKPQ